MHDHLREAALARHKSAMRRARTAVKELSASGVNVTFAAVARRAGVSTDFLYDTSELRQLIIQLRGTGPEVLVPQSSDVGGVVRALTARISHERNLHRHEVERLRDALERAHGENLELRRRLARYE